jgi:hypothetical protein
MRHLYRQWRLLRYVDKQLDAQMVGQTVAFLDKARMPAESTIENYTATPESETRKDLYALIDNHYLTRVTHGMTPLIEMDTTKGQEFIPVFSGLILGELRLLGPLWTFVGGAAAATVTLAAVRL